MLWCYELVLDLREVEHRLAELKFRGVKGTTGTQASFLELFGGDHAKVEALDRMVAEAIGFAETYPVIGPDLLAQGRHPGARRAGGHRRERAPVRHRPAAAGPRARGRGAVRGRADRLVGDGLQAQPDARRADVLAGPVRHGLPAAAGQTAATQWLERTLDDSANRRLTLPQAFLAVDAILNLYLNVVPGLVVHPAVIARHVAEELPFMATENLLMAAVQAGGDRQDLHERIRVHAMAAAGRLKDGAADNDLLERIAGRPGVPAARPRRRARPAPLHRPIGPAGRGVPGPRGRADPPPISRPTRGGPR